MKYRNLGIPDIIQFKRLLRDRGLKATPQRVAVHEAMLALIHAGADAVAAWIAEHGESISHVRFAERLASCGSAGFGELFRLSGKVRGLRLVAQCPVVACSYVASEHAYGSPLSGRLRSSTRAREYIEKYEGIVDCAFRDEISRAFFRCCRRRGDLSRFPVYLKTLSEKHRVDEVFVGFEPPGVRHGLLIHL